MRGCLPFAGEPFRVPIHLRATWPQCKRRGQAHANAPCCTDVAAGFVAGCVCVCVCVCSSPTITAGGARQDRAAAGAGQGGRLNRARQPPRVAAGRMERPFPRRRGYLRQRSAQSALFFALTDFLKRKLGGLSLGNTHVQSDTIGRAQHRRHHWPSPTPAIPLAEPNTGDTIGALRVAANTSMA
jgi:hypothetical protein